MVQQSAEELLLKKSLVTASLQLVLAIVPMNNHKLQQPCALCKLHQTSHNDQNGLIRIYLEYIEIY